MDEMDTRNKIIDTETAARIVAEGATVDQSGTGSSLLDQLKLEASDVPVIQFVNLLLMSAAAFSAS